MNSELPFLMRKKAFPVERKQQYILQVLVWKTWELKMLASLLGKILFWLSINNACIYIFIYRWELGEELKTPLLLLQLHKNLRGKKFFQQKNSAFEKF